MSGRTIRAALCLLLVAWSGAPAFAQDHTPQPYSPDEIPTWLKDLGRAEAVFIGSYPFALFVTLEVYDTWRFINPLQDPSHAAFSPSYAPWPLGSGGATAPYTATETGWLVLSSATVSLFVVGIDWILGRQHEATAGH